MPMIAAPVFVSVMEVRGHFGDKVCRTIVPRTARSMMIVVCIPPLPIRIAEVAVSTS